MESLAFVSTLITPHLLMHTLELGLLLLVVSGSEHIVLVLLQQAKMVSGMRLQK